MLIDADWSKLKFLTLAVLRKQKNPPEALPFKQACSCGHPIIIRLRTRDNVPFWGCSQWPECTSSWSIPQECYSEARYWLGRKAAFGPELQSMIKDAPKSEKCVLLTQKLHPELAGAELIAKAAGYMLLSDAEIEQKLLAGNNPEAQPESQRASIPKPAKPLVPDSRLVRVGETGHGPQVYRVFTNFRHPPLNEDMVDEILANPSAYIGGPNIGGQSYDWVTLTKGIFQHADGSPIDVRASLMHVVTGPLAHFRAAIEKTEKMNTSDNMNSVSSNEEEKEEFPGLIAQFKEAIEESPYRTARMRALTDGKSAILRMAKGQLDPSVYAFVKTILDTDVGQGIILAALGAAGPKVPKLGKNRKVQKLCQEFVKEGTAKSLNQIVTVLIAVMGPVLEKMAADIPDLATEVVQEIKMPKAKRKRVVTSKRVATTEDTEELDAEDLPHQDPVAAEA